MPLKAVKVAIARTPEILWYAMTAILIALAIATTFGSFFEVVSPIAGRLVVIGWIATAILKVGLALLVLNKNEWLGEIAVVCAMVWLVMATVVAPPSSVHEAFYTGEQTWGVAGRELTRAFILLAVFVGLGRRSRRT